MSVYNRSVHYVNHLHFYCVSVWTKCRLPLVRLHYPNPLHRRCGRHYWMTFFSLMVFPLISIWCFNKTFSMLMMLLRSKMLNIWRNWKFGKFLRDCEVVLFPIKNPFLQKKIMFTRKNIEKKTTTENLRPLQ